MLGLILVPALREITIDFIIEKYPSTSRELSLKDDTNSQSILFIVFIVWSICLYSPSLCCFFLKKKHLLILLFRSSVFSSRRELPVLSRLSRTLLSSSLVPLMSDSTPNWTRSSGSVVSRAFPTESESVSLERETTRRVLRRSFSPTSRLSMLLPLRVCKLRSLSLKSKIIRVYILLLMNLFCFLVCYFDVLMSIKSE